MCEPGKCAQCVKKELIELTTILGNYFDISNRYTWAEQAAYKNKIDSIRKNLEQQLGTKPPEVKASLKDFWGE